MGADSGKPPLPAPTETDSTTDRTELGSRLTEKSTYSLQEGNPVTISTRRGKKERDSLGLNSENNKSQTSLLIEYFEGGKGSKSESRRPSVRVKVTPSSKSRSRSTNDHIQITERKGTRKPSYTKRIPLSQSYDRSELDGDDTSLLSYRSATEESNVTSRTGGPIEVEIMPMRHGSPLIPERNSGSSFIQPNASEISSMPADSFLDGQSPERKRSRSLSRGGALATGAAAGLAAGVFSEKLRAPSRRRSRSLSRERIVAQKAVEKVRGDRSERREKSERRRKHRSRSRSVSGEHYAAEGLKSPRRRSSRSHHEESMLSGADSSLLNSHISAKSDDRYSSRSGASKSSINNPKLLETVEDAIRRLILPELATLKREQSKHRDRDRRSSVTSGSAVSRDSRDESTTRRQSDRGSDSSAKPKVILNDSEVLSGNTVKGRKDKNLDRLKLEDSPRSFERETSEDTVVHDGVRVHKKRSSDQSKGLKAAAVGAGIGALTAAALQKHQSQESVEGEKKERRRRRTKSHSRGDSLVESIEDHSHEKLIPPMPLMSEFNPSEMTRTSILSADSERPTSASEEVMTPVREVPRGVISPSPQTPTRTPTRTPAALQQGLGTQHSNYSRGNLSLNSPPEDQQVRGQEFDLNDDGRKVFMQHEREDSYTDDGNTPEKSHALAAGLAGAALGAGAAYAAGHHDDDHEDSELMEDEEEHNYYGGNQEVPPPLRYVPYAQQRRGLSPIQSVSGYTEGEPEHSRRDSRLTHTTGSQSSLGKPQAAQSGMSMRSMDSLGNVHGNQHDFNDTRQGGLTESEITQDGEYWEEQHRENDRNRDLEGAHYRSPLRQDAYNRDTTYTENSMDSPSMDRLSTGQNVRGIAANPDYVHTPLAVESAVASLVNASELTGFSNNNARNSGRRESYASYDDGSEQQFTSRGNSPAKRDIAMNQEYATSDRSSPVKRGSPAKYAEEYDLDENGRKVAMPNYKQANALEKATAATLAAGAAAAVLAGRKKQSAADQIRYEDRMEHTGAPLQKSFKERALDGNGQIPSPRHSIDAPLSEAYSQENLKLGASGLPDLDNPMPEIGFGDGDSDVITNPSIIHSASRENRDQWSRKSTPQQADYDQRSINDQRSDANLKAAEAALLGAAVGAGTAAAVSGHNREVSQDMSEDDWQRTSGERKRDTLITNPYEGTSPIAALGGDLDRQLLGQGYPGSPNYHTGSPGNFQRDEGYISSAPNARSPGGITPEPRMKAVDFLDQGNGGDPFYAPNHTRHLSGMSHGMGSPIYDSATGNGIDRIESKDIVALMDHLTVRDAQRSARDTEILVTLVRAAAEMRNSFEGMKKLLADTEDCIITEVQGNTEKSVQKMINGPRPLPQSAPRSIRQGSQDEMLNDIPNKKRNIFRKALKGLSMKSSNDLGKIEEMLVQLLGEVEGLKAAQGLVQGGHAGESYDDLHQERTYEEDRGYEPEGIAGTSTASHASQSGPLLLPLSRGPSAATTKGFDGRKFSDHRISTVPEGDEDELDHRDEHILNNQFENNEQLLTPTRDTSRGASVPLNTPPQQHIPAVSTSNENTPQTEKSKKHKSSSSSGWIPKVSRWSETTASTVLRGFRSSGRNSGKKQDDQYASPPSRSGSDLGNYPDIDPYGEDRLPPSMSQDQMQHYPENENIPISQLPPEDPKYKAHRNSLNLQHPQPRPGPTHRYQTALESQAQNFGSPMSPGSLDWGSQTSLNRLPAQQNNRYSTGTNGTMNTVNTGRMSPGRMSPISDGGYSNISASQQPPLRPPKEPLAPERPPKIRNKLTKPSPLSNEHLMNDDDAYEEVASPRIQTRKMSGSERLGVPTRKPTGPRSMSSASKSGDLNREEGTVRRNKNRDTFGTLASNHSGESETF